MSDDIDLLALLPEVQEALSADFDGIECSLGPGPDLSTKPFYFPFSHIGKQVTFLPDVSHVDNDGFDSNGLHRISLGKTSAIYTDGASGASLELVLGRGSGWKAPLTALFNKLYPSKWAFLILELEQGHALFHVLSSAHSPLTGSAKKEDTPDSVDPNSIISSPSEGSDATNFTLWLVPISRIFAIPPPKVVKKVVKKIVKKKSPAADGVATEGGEKKRVVKKIVRKSDTADKERQTPDSLNNSSSKLQVSDSVSTLVGSRESITESPQRDLEDKKSKSPVGIKILANGKSLSNEEEPPKTMFNGTANYSGLTNGLSNDLTSGLTNGLTNGLSTRLNGGSSNGDATNSELTNGLSSTRDTVNGLHNGNHNGLTNGSNGLDDLSSFSTRESRSREVTSSWLNSNGLAPSSSSTSITSSILTSPDDFLQRSSSFARKATEDFNHASTRTRSARLQQRLASLDRDAGLERSLSRTTIYEGNEDYNGADVDHRDSVTDLRKRLNGLVRDSSSSLLASSSHIDEKFQSALAASRRLGLDTPLRSSSRSRIISELRRSKSPPLGSITEGLGRKERRLTPPRTVVGEVVCKSQVGDMPFLALHQVLKRSFTYEELGRLREVHPHWDEVCGQELNSAYYRLLEKSDKLLMALQRKVSDEPELHYPTSVLTNIQVHILNPVDVMRAALDEGVGCFVYGRILDKTLKLVEQVREMAQGGPQHDVPWEPVATLARKAALHYKSHMESVMEERMGETVRLKAAQKLIRLDSFMVESSVQKLEKDTNKAKEDLMWEIEQLQVQNQQLRRENRTLKQDHMKLEARVESLESKFKTMARLLS